MVHRFHFFINHYFGIKTYKRWNLSDDLTLFLPFGKRDFLAKSRKAKNLKKNLAKNPINRSANPYAFFRDKSLKDLVILGVGANVEKKSGECVVRFLKLLFKLKNKNAIISTSVILKNPAFGYTKQADFYNMIVWLKTKLGFVDFWSYCAYLERIFKRERKRPFKNAPRTMDLDIIGFKNKRVAFRHFKIPHIAWQERESVRIPLFWSNR